MSTSRTSNGSALWMAAAILMLSAQSLLADAPPDGVSCPVADECLSCCPEQPPCFVVRGGALVLRPRSHGPVPLVNAGNTTLEAADLDLNFQAGWELAGIWNAGPNLGFELRYFEVDSWTKTIEDQFVSGIQTSNVQGYSILTFPVFDIVELVSYRSALQSGEINARLASWESITLLAGFRSLALNESIRIDATASDAEVDVINQLYGFQVGLEGNWSWRRLSLTGFCKGGAYNTKSTLDIPTFSAQDLVPVINNHVTLVGEAALLANIDVTRNLSFRTGYQVLWMPGVALATDQFTSHPPNGVYGNDLEVLTNSGVFFHGFFLGMEGRW